MFWRQGKYAAAVAAYENAGDFETARQVRKSERTAVEAVEEYESAIEELGRPPWKLPWNPAK